MTATTVHAADDLPLTLPALLHARAAALGERAFVVCDDDVLTYGEADRRSASIARGLLAIGAGKGTPVGVLHPNGSAFIASALAAARIGAVAVPLSTFSTATELATLLRGADIRVLLSARSYRNHDYAATLAAAVPDLELGARPPLFAPSTPALRHVVFSEPNGDVAPGWSTQALDHRRGTRRPGGTGRRRARGHAGRPPGDRAHVRLDERAEGGDPRPRRR